MDKTPDPLSRRDRLDDERVLRMDAALYHCCHDLINFNAVLGDLAGDVALDKRVDGFAGGFFDLVCQETQVRVLHTHDERRAELRHQEP